MATKEEMRKKLFTEEGVKTLDIKIKTMVDLFNKNIFPLSVVMLGFSKLEIETREECLHRVIELCQIIGRNIKITKKIEEYSDGKLIEMEEMEIE